MEDLTLRKSEGTKKEKKERTHLKIVGGHWKRKKERNILKQ